MTLPPEPGFREKQILDKRECKMPLPGSILSDAGHILDKDDAKAFAEAFIRVVGCFPKKNPAG